MQLEIEAVAPGGEGLARDGARPVFVPFTAAGDRVEADVPPGDGAAHAELVRVLAPGADRVEPPCPHFGPDGDLCGGCEWLHLRYEAQLAAKERGLVETLRRIGKVEPGAYALSPILPSPAPLRYRSRAKLHWDRALGRLVYFRRRSHDAVPVRVCHLLHPALDALREALNPALAAARLDVREVALEWSEEEARGAAWLKLAALSRGGSARAEQLLDAVPALAGLVLTAEGGAAPVIAGDPVLRVARAPGDAGAGRQRTRPDVFQQANRGANAALVAQAVEWIAGDDVLELYCGAGNFTAALAARSRTVYAVEVQGPSLELARADLGGRNVRFHAGDALAVARGLAREGRRFDAALLDPPREGAKGIGPVLRDLGIRVAVYVSCDPATLARDVRGCVEAGFRVAAVRAADLFPQTHHVEGVVRLERR